MYGKMKQRILLTTEGTYPFHHGGVSTWCDAIVKNLSGSFEFFVYSIMMNPFVTQKFSLPGDATLIKVPLWGTEEPGEYLDIPFSRVYLTKKRTNDLVIKEKFLPLFMEMVEEIVGREKDPVRFGQVLSELYLYFEKYDYKQSFKSELTFGAYKDYIMRLTRQKDGAIPPPGIFSIIHSLAWLYRFMVVLNTPIPEVDVTHSSAAAFCGIPCAIAKIRSGTPFMLTEHGVYLREQYLSLSERSYSSFLTTFFIRLIRSVVSLSYHYADRVSPVCGYNTRWEQRLGVDGKRIDVIYNGVDNAVFGPAAEGEKRGAPSVVCVARIDPVKDILTLIRAAALVKAEVPDVRFTVYGSVTVEEYYRECLALRDSLGLGESFGFAGHTSEPSTVYSKGDIIALSSISEGFPYSITEAMMSAKPVVATDVGGIKEVVGDCGILVPPRRPDVFAAAVVRLLRDPELRAALGGEGRDRALSRFNISRMNGQYTESYEKLSAKAEKVPEKPPGVYDTGGEKQALLTEKGEILKSLGYYREAIGQFRAAVLRSPSPEAAQLLFNIADCYFMLNENDKAAAELEKAALLSGAFEASEAR